MFSLEMYKIVKKYIFFTDHPPFTEILKFVRGKISSESLSKGANIRTSYNLVGLKIPIRFNQMFKRNGFLSIYTANH